MGGKKKGDFVLKPRLRYAFFTVNSEIENIKEEKILAIASSLEKNSEHPLGQAIYKHGQTQDLNMEEVTDFKIFEGMGITGTIKNTQYFLGNKKLIAKNSEVLDEFSNS